MPLGPFRSFRLAAALLLTLAWGMAAGAVPVHVAVLAFRPAAEVRTHWQPLIEYLNERMPGYDFQCEAYGYGELEAAIARREVDFVLTNPAHYMLMTYRNGLSSPLATLVPVGRGRALGKFGGVIFVRSDRSELASLENLRDRTIATVTEGSFGGYQAEAVELLQLGIRLPRDARLLETGMPQDLVVRAVLDGRADAGFVRTGLLEDMASEGKLEVTQIRVLAPKNVPGFPLLLSTRLYPEWPFAAMPAVDEDLARQVTAALLALPHGGDLARRLAIHGFTIPTDYESVRITLQALRLPPFDVAPQFTTEDIWNKYRWQLVTAMALVSVITLLSALLLVLNRRLADRQHTIQHTSQEWHRLLTALGEGVYGVDAHGLCTYINPAALTMLGFSADEVLGRNQHELFHHHREDGTPNPAPECPVGMTLKDGETRVAEEWFWRKDGSGFPVTLTTAPKGQDFHEGAVVVFRDISERRQLERRLREEATTDSLTGVANRRLFIERLDVELERFKRLGEPAALLMADLDHFKKINDGYGHAAGDAVLRHVADLSRQCLRRVDLLGRLGGEEFGILLPGTDAAGAVQFAERFRRLLMETPAPTGKGPISFTVSVGVSEFEADDATIDSVLARSDVALYRAKERGRNVTEVFREAHADGPSSVGAETPLVRLAWKPAYACGEPAIDKEHRQLFRLANLLLDHAAVRDIRPGAFTDAFDALISHAVRHFAHEEAILRARGYPDLDEHAACHERLLERALALRRQAGESGVSMGELVDFLVSEVVSGHMLHEDERFYGMLAAPGIRCE